MSTGKTMRETIGYTLFNAHFETKRERAKSDYVKKKKKIILYLIAKNKKK